jgi:hypothetical protein
MTFSHRAWCSSLDVHRVMHLPFNGRYVESGAMRNHRTRTDGAHSAGRALERRDAALQRRERALLRRRPLARRRRLARRHLLLALCLSQRVEHTSTPTARIALRCLGISYCRLEFLDARLQLPLALARRGRRCTCGGRGCCRRIRPMRRLCVSFLRLLAVLCLYLPK